MQSTVRKLGNSTGVIIPKAVLDEAGLAAGDRIDITLTNGNLILARVERTARSGWAEQARAVAAAGEDALVWPEFSNAQDDALEW